MFYNLKRGSYAGKGSTILKTTHQQRHVRLIIKVYYLGAQLLAIMLSWKIVYVTRIPIAQRQIVRGRHTSRWTARADTIFHCNTAQRCHIVIWSLQYYIIVITYYCFIRPHDLVRVVIICFLDLNIAEILDRVVR